MPVVFNTCPFKSSGTITPIGNVAPLNVCKSDCALFLHVRGPQGQPIPTGCALAVLASAVHNLASNIVVQATKASGQKPPESPPAS